jgi:nucleotide-binding universal stress UspA family protein
MAQRALHALRRPGLAYRRIVVPLDTSEESEAAMALAAELADEHGTSIEVVVAIELPPQLPLEAHMLEEEAAARRVLEDARAIAGSCGLRVRTRVVRARQAGEAIVAAAEEVDADLIVMNAPRKTRLGRRASIFGRTVRHVLHHAPCRVLVATTPL